MWEYTIRLVDSYGKTSSLTFVLDVADMTGAGYDTAVSLANQIRGALVDLTDAFVQSEKVSNTIFADNTLPTGNVVIANEGVLFTHLNAPNEKQKLHALRIPAISFAHIDTEGSVMADPQVLQYVQQVAQGAVVSDGEKINQASGNSGFAYGYLRSKHTTYN